MFDTWRLLGPVMGLIEPERAHDLALRALEAGVAGRRASRERPRLATTLFGLRFPNPLGLAAGFDKNARVTSQMLAAGFGFVEAGTVTPRAQAGNRRPRIFRLPADRAVINRLGFNNEGMDRVAARLEARRPEAGIVGVNIGMNRDSADAADDYRRAFIRLAPLADYVVINVSSPNTPGLRDLQAVRQLARLLESLQGVRPEVPDVALLLKLAPDLATEDAGEAARVAADHGIAGLVVSNTTISRPAGLRHRHAGEAGGLSGAPLFELSTSMVRTLHRAGNGALPVIGTGGIMSAEDAYRKIRAGASLIQIYTALVWHGLAVVGLILDGLEERLAADGLESLAEAVGADS
ncbi:MAG: quinone-dependent dihydroorotate dehydrogenase [bacterium]|nr:quinone-dependent dihydroorotate dehydrogenase [bacterium]MDE0416635.1 quinone-dependent dihydroorotate dehydrogenase [bacterium]